MSACPHGVEHTAPAVAEAVYERLYAEGLDQCCCCLTVVRGEEMYLDVCRSCAPMAPDGWWDCPPDDRYNRRWPDDQQTDIMTIPDQEENQP